MPNELERIRPTGLAGSGSVPDRLRQRRTAQALSVVEHNAMIRMAEVQAEGYVQTEKLHEIDHLTREAMSGHAMLQGWARQLAGDDMILADELRFFTDTARLGKGEVLADTISAFCRR
jgi:hypothetical protein